MINLITKMVVTLRNIVDPDPLPVAMHAERLSSTVCARADEYVREHEALSAAIRESRVERFRRPQVVRARAGR